MELYSKIRILNNKASKDDLEVYIHKFGVGKVFLKRIQKPLIIKNSSSSSYTTKEEKQDTDLNKILTIHISIKALHLYLDIYILKTSPK